MFSYLLGNVNGLISQVNAVENLRSQQSEDFEEWLLKLERSGKSKRLDEKLIESINKYMANYWHYNVKDIDQECEFIRFLSPKLKAKVHFCLF